MTAAFRLLIAINHPAQYISPLLVELARRADLLVVYTDVDSAKAHFDPGFDQIIEWEEDLLAGYTHVTVGSGVPGLVRTLRQIRRFQPEALLSFGWNSASHWATRCHLPRHSSTRLLVCDATGQRGANLVRRTVRALRTRVFCAMTDLVLPISDANKRYYLSSGVPPERMFPWGLPVEAATGKLDRNVLRMQLGLREDTFVVCQTGKLSPGKRPLDLLDACQAARSRGVKVQGLLCGDGLLRSVVADRISRYGHHDVCTGFLPYAAARRAMHAADALALCSDQEAYGMVLGEAAAAGLPLLVSSQVGGAGSLGPAQPGNNARIFPCGDVEALSDAIISIALNPDELQRMKLLSRDIGAELAPDQLAEALMRALTGP